MIVTRVTIRTVNDARSGVLSSGGDSAIRLPVGLAIGSFVTSDMVYIAVLNQRLAFAANFS